MLKAKEIINIEGYIWRISEHTYSKYVSYKKKHEGISIDGMQVPVFESYSFEAPDDEIKQLRREIAFLIKNAVRLFSVFITKKKLLVETFT